MALAQFPREGIAEAQLERRLGMSAAEASRMRGTLLRRKLVRRSPAGRSRSGSRLLLTERGKRASRWLEELQTSLPTTLFEEAEPPSRELEEPLEAVSPHLESGREARRLGRLRPHRHRPEPMLEVAGEPDEGHREGTFERGLLNVWLGTCAFAGAVLIGVLYQTERAGLIALGAGLAVAIFFFVRAAVVMIRHARAERAKGRGWRPFGWLHHPGGTSHRPRSGGAVS